MLLEKNPNIVLPNSQDNMDTGPLFVKCLLLLCACSCVIGHVSCHSIYCMSACLHVCIFASLQSLHVCMFAYLHVCMFACLHVCRFTCLGVRLNCCPIPTAGDLRHPFLNTRTKALLRISVWCKDWLVHKQPQSLHPSWQHSCWQEHSARKLWGLSSPLTHKFMSSCCVIDILWRKGR